VTELPSAALPLLVSDLSTFVWWRSALQVGDKILHNLLSASDRLIIDSAEFANPQRDLAETNKLFDEDIASVGVSDLNWARLTSWRGLLADFFDVPAFRASLDQIDSVRIEYVGPASASQNVAPQALLIAGWLASRLAWQLDNEQRQENEETTSFTFKSSRPAEGDTVQDRGSSPTVRESFADRTITVELKRVEQGERKPGRLAAVELKTGEDGASFTVSRSADNLHLVTEARVGANVHRGRVLPVRNRSAAHLLSREMEILCNDQIYQEAVAAAAMMLARLTFPSR
jgi:glucose-6-phosphate dehydrogenase assembly protein OpcA